MTSNTNWDKFWSHKFVYGSLKGWEVDLFLNIATLLKNIENPTILSAGCGRGKIDYWIINTLGYKSTLLDYSHACIKNLTKSFKKLNKENYVLREGSILDLPFPDDSFDLVWNAGVLEHFQEADYQTAISEMVRVSRNYVLIDVPYAKSKPYILAKQWIEQNSSWPWGYEDPKVTLKPDLEAVGFRVLKEIPIGSPLTNMNYVNLIPENRRNDVLTQLNPEDFDVPPHLMVIGEKIISK